MSNALLPTAADTRTNAAFEEMMWALSRPGQVRTLPANGIAVIAESVLDNECSYHILGDLDLDTAVGQSSARKTTIAEAEFVFATVDDEASVASLSNIQTGDLSYPDRGATLITAATFGSGTGIKLTGPGIKDSLTIAIDGVCPAFWSLRETSIRYPLGFDVFLVDGDRVIGLPRSTKIEVL